MELWLTERETDDLHVRCKIANTVHRERSSYQDIAVVDTEEMGRALVLDGIIQTTLRDEFIYHEMLAHVPLFTHPHPEVVLVVGGGDGGTVREVLRHPTVREVHLVEIDERVIEVCRTYLPELSDCLRDPRVRLTVGDGIEYVNSAPSRYDVILVDSSDPLGPAEGLFTHDFYESAARILQDDGVFVAQTESPFFSPELVQEVYHSIRGAFGSAWMYLVNVPIYSLGEWSFTLATARHDPLQSRMEPGQETPFSTRYYTPKVHQGAFALPRFIIDTLAMTDPKAMTAGRKQRRSENRI